MKKLLSILLCGVLAIGVLGGCGSEVEAEKPQEIQQEQVVAEESQEQKDSRGIKGSNYMGLTTVLEVGLEFSSNEPKEIKDGLKYISSTEKQFDSGIKQAYMVSYDTDNQIVEADFLTANMNQIDEDVFLDSAKIYFSLLAKTSYDTSDEEAAGKWLEDNISNVNEEGISTIIGDAKFSLECRKTSDGTLGTITFVMEKETTE
jgi:hypothetical protein